MADADWLTVPQKVAIASAGWAAKKLYGIWRTRRANASLRRNATGLKPMAYRRRRYRRRSFRRRFKRVYRRRRFRRSRRGGAITRTAVTNFEVQVSNSLNKLLPLNFEGQELINGIGDYLAAFTEFRILKVDLTITDPSASDGKNIALAERYLYAPSKPMAKFMGSSNTVEGANSVDFLRVRMNIPLTQLQQLRGVRYIIPSAVGTKFHVRFVPYRMSWQLNGLDQTNQIPPNYLGRPVSASRWMPISWIKPTSSPPAVPPYFIGPYLAPLDALANSGERIYGVAKVTYQVRGQV